MKKICSKCLIEKDICEFHIHVREKDGRCSHCKECRKIKSKIDYLKIMKNDKLIITGKTCSSCLIEKEINQFHKQIGSRDGYRSACKECRNENFRDNYRDLSGFSEKHKERTKNYRLNNREKVNKYFKRRYIEKPHEYAWRGMLASVIRRLGTKKESQTYEILGYSAGQLKTHMENLFEDGMSWGNWGKWHIDHKIPISFFDQNEDPKIINSLDNLQPMWASENISKGNKFYGK